MDGDSSYRDEEEKEDEGNFGGGPQSHSPTCIPAHLVMSPNVRLYMKNKNVE